MCNFHQHFRLPILAITLVFTAFFLACEDDSHGNPTVKITYPLNGDTVSNPVMLHLQTTGFDGHAPAPKITSAEGVVATGGHLHVFIDNPATTNAAADTVLEPSQTMVTLNDSLAPGLHYIIVNAASDAHVTYPGAQDSVKFTVR